MILLWGAPGDAPLDAVSQALRERGAHARLLDQRYAAQTRVSLAIANDGALAGSISDPQGDIVVSEIGAVYLRPIETTKALGVDDPSDPALIRAIATDAALIAWGDATTAAVVNRPAAMTPNNSKPHQLRLISELGFAVPDTLVTTDATAARSFRRSYEDVIYKSVSGVRSIVSRLGEIDDEALADIANCPTQFQQYVPGTDIRVHVVGDATFACEIRSSADDYRYATRTHASVAMAAIDLAPDVAASCVAMARAMNLHVAGIDFRRTPEGRLFCLEVNPSPGFTYYEAATSQPISAAVADLLVRLDRSAAISAPSLRSAGRSRRGSSAPT